MEACEAIRRGAMQVNRISICTERLSSLFSGYPQLVKVSPRLDGRPLRDDVIFFDRFHHEQSAGEDELLDFELLQCPQQAPRAFDGERAVEWTRFP